MWLVAASLSKPPNLLYVVIYYLAVYVSHNISQIQKMFTRLNLITKTTRDLNFKYVALM